MGFPGGDSEAARRHSGVTATVTLAARRDPQRIAQGAAESVEPHRHDVAVAQRDAVAVAEAVGAEEMDVDVAGSAVPLVLEVVVLDVGQAVAHGLLAGGDRRGPDRGAVAFDGDSAAHQREVRIERPAPGPTRRWRSLDDARCR